MQGKSDRIWLLIQRDEESISVEAMADPSHVGSGGRRIPKHVAIRDEGVVTKALRDEMGDLIQRFTKCPDAGQ